MAGLATVSRPEMEEILEVLARASVGDFHTRVEVAPDALDDPLSLIGNAVNLLLDDLDYRQREREQALTVASEARAKEEMLAYLSHDMQTPLAMLLGTLNLLESSPTEDELATALPIMHRAAGRLQRFVQQFLDLARLGAERPLLVRPEPVLLRPLLERVAAMFADKGPVTIELEDELPPAYADGERVEQILANLVSNAFKYAGTSDVSMVAGRASEGIAVEVVDRGTGMHPAEVERAFAKFERGERAAGIAGTGLGLYLSRALAEAQDATLEVVTAPGRGCRFVLTLPVAG